MIRIKDSNSNSSSETATTTFGRAYMLDTDFVHGFQQAAENGQNRLALEYLVPYLAAFEARLEGLQAEIDQLKSVKPAAIKSTASKAKTAPKAQAEEA